MASAALAAQILQEGDPARERYMNFLKSGNSHYALDTLELAGVDMRTESPVVLALQYMNTLLDEMEALL